MTHSEVALEFLRCFCAGDIAALTALLTEDLRFSGPLYRFDSRQAYLDCLEKAPPRPCPYRVLSVTQNADSISVFYDYQKADGAVTVAQLFRFRGGRIRELLVVFDARALSSG